MRKERRFIHKPWTAKGIINSIKNKQKLYISHFLNGNNNQKKKYKKYANKLTKSSFLVKQLFYESEFNETKQDISKTRNIFKSLPSNQKLKQFPTKLHVRGNIVNTPSQMATELNLYFSKIGKIF